MDFTDLRNWASQVRHQSQTEIWIGPINISYLASHVRLLLFLRGWEGSGKLVGERGCWNDRGPETQQHSSLLSTLWLPILLEPVGFSQTDHKQWERRNKSKHWIFIPQEPHKHLSSHSVSNKGLYNVYEWFDRCSMGSGAINFGFQAGSHIQ